MTNGMMFGAEHLWMASRATCCTASIQSHMQRILNKLPMLPNDVTLAHDPCFNEHAPRPNPARKWCRELYKTRNGETPRFAISSMFSETTSRESALWWMYLLAIAICAAPISLRGQMITDRQPSQTAIDMPFAGYDDALTKAANTMVVSVAQPTTAVIGNEDVQELSIERPTVHDDHQQKLSDIGTGAAVRLDKRLEILRPIVEPILRAHGVPVDLAAVVLVESGARADAISPMGARGLWQLMPDTARRYGLRVDDVEDDRLDISDSTDAAARYLHDLYMQFGDWKLVLAAYNDGEASVGAAILRAHSEDFDKLSSMRLLPVETITYVPRVLAAMRSTSRLRSFTEYSGSAASITVFASSKH